MIEEKIVISDTNILLDLISINILDIFFNLPCEFYTTDFVINEIKKPNQIQAIDKFVKSNKLDIINFDFTEMININNIQSKTDNNVSITDCSVWYYAKKTGGRLLTGDGNLRKSAEKDNVKVSGILYIFDNLVEYEILAKSEAAELLNRLLNINKRLPADECKKRINHWRKL